MHNYSFCTFDTHLVCGLVDLYEKKVITKIDFEYFSSFESTPIDSSLFMQKLILDTARKGFFEQRSHVSETNLNNCLTCISKIFAAAQFVEMYVNVQLPFPFVQIVALTSYCFIMQLFLVSSSYIALGLSTHNSSYIIIGAVTISLYNVVLIGMMQLFVILGNPMSDYNSNFAFTSFLDAFAEKLFELADHAFELEELTDFEESLVDDVVHEMNGDFTAIGIDYMNLN